MEVKIVIWIPNFLSRILDSQAKAPVVQKVDDAIHWINLFTLDSDISGG